MRHRYILSTLTLFLFFVSALGKPVTLTEVREAVYSLTQSWDKDLEIEGIEARYLPGGGLGYYMVDLGQEGWVMVSADDALRPVLAFSFENRMTPEEEWNDAARYLLNLYKEEISTALKDPDVQRDERWDMAVLPSEKKAATATSVEPIIDVQWDQGGGWNMFCPVDEAGPQDRVYVGCVAVAMAQAMSVYEYPVRPQGIMSYVHDVYGSIAVNYDNADPYEWGQMSATSADSFNAILLYHCAVSVEMDFAPDGSGAYVRTAGQAMTQYFSYSKSISFKDRYSDPDEWVAVLVDELEAGRPIVYRGNGGDGLAGHAWNVDGYYESNGIDYFHMNFGWSGSQNAYYTLDYINPGSLDFNSGQGALIGISPPTSSPYDITLSDLSVSEDLPDSSLVADVVVEDEDPDNVYSFTCKGAYNILLDDYGPASFYISGGQLFTDKVFEFDDVNLDNNAVFLRIIVEDQYGNEYTEDFEISIEELYNGPLGIALSDTSVLENQPVGTAVAKLMVEDEKTTNSYTYTLYGANDPAAFYVEDDTLRTSVVFDRELADTSYLLVELLDSYGNELSRAFTIQIDKDQSGSTAVIPVSLEIDLLYPNPADHTVTIRNVDQNSSVEFYEITGRKLARLENVSGTIDVSNLPEGIYLVVVRSEKGTALQKLLIQH